MEPLSGSALVLLAITISLLALSWLSFVLRVAARRLVHALALDDLLMGLGVVRRSRLRADSGFQC